MTLVSVIGDFFSSVAPIFYHYKDSIKNHIIISDDSKRDDKLARKFEKGVREFCKRNNLNINHYYMSFDEDSFEALDRVRDFILKNSDGDLYINSTDGLSSVNTYFSLRMLPLGAKIISYDMFDNEANIVDMNGMRREKISVVPIKEHFTLKGVDILSKESKVIAEIYQEELFDLFRKHHREYKRFKYEVTVNNKLPSRSEYKNIYKILDEMKITNKDMDLEVIFQRITGDLFEMYIYLLVKDLGFDDIEIGVEVEDDYVRNEYDLLLMKDNHLHIIECKHRKLYYSDIERLIYKYSTLKRMVDEDAKAIIITLTDKYSKNSVNRALSNNIALFNHNRYLQKHIKEFLIEGKYDENYIKAPSNYGKRVKNFNIQERVGKIKK